MVTLMKLRMMFDGDGDGDGDDEEYDEDVEGDDDDGECDDDDRGGRCVCCARIWHSNPELNSIQSKSLFQTSVAFAPASKTELKSAVDRC